MQKPAVALWAELSTGCSIWPVPVWEAHAVFLQHKRVHGSAVISEDVCLWYSSKLTSEGCELIAKEPQKPAFLFHGPDYMDYFWYKILSKGYNLCRGSDNWCFVVISSAITGFSGDKHCLWLHGLSSIGTRLLPHKTIAKLQYHYPLNCKRRKKWFLKNTMILHKQTDSNFWDSN